MGGGKGLSSMRKRRGRYCGVEYSDETDYGKY